MFLKYVDCRLVGRFYLSIGLRISIEFMDLVQAVNRLKYYLALQFQASEMIVWLSHFIECELVVKKKILTEELL